VTGLRVAFLCMESLFSVEPLRALIRAGHDVRFVVRPSGVLTTRNDATLQRISAFDVVLRKLAGQRDDNDTDPFVLARAHDIPAYLCGNVNTPSMAKLMMDERIDIIVIAFFNQLLKPMIYEAAALGAINLHPSRLPRWRGPAPLFWQYANFDLDGALSTHCVAAGADTGAVLDVVDVPMLCGQPGEDHIDALAMIAGDAAVRAVAARRAGHGGHVQHGAPTLAPRPTSADLRLRGDVGAEHLFHMVRGLGRYYPLLASVKGQDIRVVDAYEWTREPVATTTRTEVWVRAADGYVRCRTQGAIDVHS
jgi:methionyl-tRNA formyltransferase